ncbi:MAG: type II secretion system protein [Candidatus Palauibacterales bacterium]|nr:type II secretion system protein [Candidatus Palauibacterales bacterium]
MISDVRRCGNRARTIRRRRGGSGPVPGNRGFTIVELLISVTLAGLVAAAAFGLLRSEQESVRAQRITRALQQNSRYVLDLVRRDIQEAGEGMDPTPEFGVVAATNSASGTRDSVFVLYVEPNTPRHAALDPTPGTGGSAKDSARLAIRCNDDVDDIGENSFVYFASGTKRGVAVVRDTVRRISDSCDASDPGSKQIGHVKLDIDAIDGETHGWTLRGNTAGAGVTRVNAVSYFVDDSGDEPDLMRATRYAADGTWTGRPLAEGVTDLRSQLVFQSGDTLEVANGTDGVADNDYDDINTVMIQVDVRATRTDRALASGDTLRRRYALSVSPRNAIYTRNLQP